MTTLKEWLGFCNHKWKTIKIENIILVGTTSILGKIYHLRCEHCGKIKFQKFTV